MVAALHPSRTARDLAADRGPRRDGRRAAANQEGPRLTFPSEMRAEFAAGARNAVRACLNIGPQDRVCIIRDRPRTEIADAIAEESRATGAAVQVWTMEDHLRRPATSFPAALAGELVRFRPTASFFIGTGLKGELAFRQPMLHLLADELHCRHGHMIGINDRVMTDGMAARYERIRQVPRTGM